MPTSFTALAVLVLLSLVGPAAAQPELKHRDPLPVNGTTEYRVEQGVRIPVKLLNTVHTRISDSGERVLLQTVFPIMAARRVVIPAGSYIDAELIGLRRVGHAKDRAELLVKLDALTLPDGIERKLRSDPAAGGSRDESNSSHADAAKGQKATREFCPHATIAAAFTMHGPEAVFVPGETADVVLRDPILFTPEEVGAKPRP